MPFSWDYAKKRAIEVKVERAMIMSKGNVNSDFDVQHPTWVKAAQAKNYAEMKKVVIDRIVKSQELAMKRRDKLVRKD